jgi:hypothetical protein
VVSICLRCGRDAEKIEGAVLCPGGGGEDGGEAIAPEADDIAGERGEIAEQSVEAVHRERFAPRFREGRLGRVDIDFADELVVLLSTAAERSANFRLRARIE